MASLQADLFSALCRFLPWHFCAFLSGLRKTYSNRLLAVLDFMFAGAHVMHLCAHLLAGFVAVLPSP